VKRSKKLPAWYAVLYIRVAAKARSMGYAIAVHGSMVRDVDLIAIPWTDNAVSARELVKAIAAICNGYLAQSKPEEGGRYRVPMIKPHGRLAYSIHLGGGPYIDLSVMPRKRKRDTK
jgi:hypothetical protein